MDHHQTPNQARLPASLRDRYQLREVLGEGGFGRVLACLDRRTGREVALKLLARSLAAPEDRRRFRREAEATARVRHPGVVPVLASGVTEDGQDAYVVYDRIEGVDLAQRLARGGPLEGPELRRLGVAVAAALQAVHEAGIVHRDVKPANVVLGPQGDPVLVDFGIARVTDAGTQLTAEGMILGTPATMAPELLRGEAPTPASDQFAWAASLVELAGGAPVHGARDPAGVVAAVAAGRDPQLDAAAAGRLGTAAGAVRRALAADPRARFASLADLGRALQEDVADEREPAPADPGATRVLKDPGDERGPGPRRPARSRGRAGLAALLVAAGLAGYASRSGPGTAPAASAGEAPTPAPPGPPEDPAEARLRRALEALSTQLPAALHRPPEGGYEDSHLELAYPVLITLRFGEAFAQVLRAGAAWVESSPRVGPAATMLSRDFGVRTYVVAALYRKLHERLEAGGDRARTAIELLGNRPRRGLGDGWDPAAIRERYRVVRADAMAFLCRLDGLEAPGVIAMEAAKPVLGQFGEGEEDPACPSAPGRGRRYLEVQRALARDPGGLAERRTLVWYLGRLEARASVDLATRRELLLQEVARPGPASSAPPPTWVWLRAETLVELWRLAYRYPEAEAGSLTAAMGRLVDDLAAAGEPGAARLEWVAIRFGEIRDSFRYLERAELRPVQARVRSLAAPARVPGAP